MKNPTRDLLLDTARSYVGYRAQPNRDSIFGRTVGYPNNDWDGAFLDVVFKEAGIRAPSLFNFAHSLSVFLHQRRARKTPQPGDIVYLNFQRVGLVVDTAQWKSEHSVKVIEGQTATGLPRGHQESDGVYERVRYNTEVLAFVRPKFRVSPAPQEMTAELVKALPLVRQTHFQYGKSHRSVELIQVALSETVGLQDAKRGLFDSRTRAAYAAYQRKIGYNLTDSNGQPEDASLQRLATDTGNSIFRIL